MRLWKYVLGVIAGMIMGILAILWWLDYRQAQAFHGDYGHHLRLRFEHISLAEQESVSADFSSMLEIN